MEKNTGNWRSNGAPDIAGLFEVQISKVNKNIFYVSNLLIDGIYIGY